ncbi:MAG: M48 family metallopeptidase [Candidatus Acidiferrales bacterium]
MHLRQVRAANWSLLVRRATALALAAGLAFTAPSSWADRTPLKPGINMYSTADDIRMGQKLADEAEAKLPMLNDARVEDYLNRLGRKLASFAPGAKYPYEFHCVNSDALNAFALPGGFVFVNRAVIEESRDEAQLAGVIAHEIGHVALRHGTNQATKKEMGSDLVGIAGGIIGGGILTSLATQVGGNLAASAVFLKYSRTAEGQADILGTQILYDAGYDPRAMAQFFETIESESKGKRKPEFFSDHPIPAHRIDKVTDEIENMGGQPENYKTDSAEFREIRRYIISLPPAPVKGQKGIFNAPKDPAAIEHNPAGAPGTSNSTPASGGANAPSAAATAAFPDSTEYEGISFTIRYPESWKQSGDGDAIKLVPLGRLMKDADGHAVTTVGVTTDTFSANSAEGNATLTLATDALLANLKAADPTLKTMGEGEAIQVDGQAAVSMKLAADSTLGVQETRWVVTVLRPEGLVYFVCFAPANDYAGYDEVFKQIISTIRFSH